MEGSKVLRGVFFGLACAILMSTLYMAFFGVGSWEGALFYASRQVEHPISKYYYTYCYLPNVHMEDGVDVSLGATLAEDYSSIMKTESDLSSPTSDNSSFGTENYHYSSGWY